jgi:hypothetical protein
MSEQQGVRPRGLLRQGDVLLVPIERIPNGAVPSTSRRSPLVLAEGEATGHAHVLRGQSVRLLRHRSPSIAPDKQYLLVEHEPAMLMHEEHDSIRVPPGAYRVVRQREYEPRSWREVAD